MEKLSNVWPRFNLQPGKLRRLYSEFCRGEEAQLRGELAFCDLFSYESSWSCFSANFFFFILL